LLALIVAILKAFTEAFLLLFSKIALLIVAVLGVVALILILTGTLSFEAFHRRK